MIQNIPLSILRKLQYDFFTSNFGKSKNNKMQKFDFVKKKLSMVYFITLDKDMVKKTG